MATFWQDYWQQLLINYKSKKNKIMSTENFVVGALAGLAAGVVVGFLLAPASGEETRQNIAEGTGKLTKKIKRFAGKAEDEYNDVKDNVQQGVENWADNTRPNSFS